MQQILFRKNSVSCQNVVILYLLDTTRRQPHFFQTQPTCCSAKGPVGVNRTHHLKEVRHQMASLHRLLLYLPYKICIQVVFVWWLSGGVVLIVTWFYGGLAHRSLENGYLKSPSLLVRGKITLKQNPFGGGSQKIQKAIPKTLVEPGKCSQKQVFFFLGVSF